ncbi:MAG: MBL fold metallo-hydrolase [Thermaerobacter sp.]|nr:MBL fold metallo-hydrolase [Thermaerobacter sp.]
MKAERRVRWLTERVGILPGPVNRGVVRLEGDQALVVDTGLDRDAARGLLAALRAEALQPILILNTHAHADHMGGNAQLVRASGARVGTTPGEAAFLRFPLLESFSLFGGAHPPLPLRPRFLLAEPSPVDLMLTGETPLPGGVRMLSLPGHSLEHSGFLVDGVLFCGDAYLGRQVLEKHGLPFAVRIDHLLSSMEAIDETKASWFVPAHGEPCPDPGEDLRANRRLVGEIRQAVLSSLDAPRETGAVAAAVGKTLGCPAAHPVQALLAEATVRSVLSWLCDQAVIAPVVDEGQLRWKKV